MKKILSLFLVFSPLLTFGQAFEFGLSGGASTSTARLGTLPVGYTEKGLQFSYAASFAVLMNFSSWQLGIKAEAYELRTKYDLVVPTVTGDVKTSGTNTFASPQLPILLTINKLFYQRKSYIYFGLSGWSAINFQKNTAGETKYIGLQPVYGAQLGYTYGLSNFIGLNAELAARYNSIPGGPVISFPLTVGIRIRP